MKGVVIQPLTNCKRLTQRQRGPKAAPGGSMEFNDFCEALKLWTRNEKFALSHLSENDFDQLATLVGGLFKVVEKESYTRQRIWTDDDTEN